MKEARFRPWPCTGCGFVMDAATAADGSDAAPKQGDLSVCIKCGKLHMLDRRRWRVMTLMEMARLSPEERTAIELAQRALREVNEL